MKSRDTYRNCRILLLTILLMATLLVAVSCGGDKNPLYTITDTVVDGTPIDGTPAETPFDSETDPTSETADDPMDTQTPTDTSTTETIPVFETETKPPYAKDDPQMLIDNIASETPSSMPMFDTSDKGAQSAIQLNIDTGLYFKANATFNGVTVGFPAWGNPTTYCTVSLYTWKDNWHDTLDGEALVSIQVTNIQDCAFTNIPFDQTFEAGHYLLYFSEAGSEDGQGYPGLWNFQSNVSLGQLYRHGRKTTGEIQAWVNFTVTPTIPFGPLDDLYGTSTTQAEKSQALTRYHALLANLAAFPVSFTIGDTAYNGFDPNAFSTLDTQVEKGTVSETTTVTLDHLQSDIKLTLVAAIYPEYAAYEWTLYFTNEGSSNSPQISDINGCNYTFEATNPHLRGIYGDGGYDEIGYMPYDINFSGMSMEIKNETGRATYNRFPYFNIAYGGGGAFFAVGWPGQWRAGFESWENKVTVTDGQVTLDTYLKPGESIRTPLSCFLFYNGEDKNRATNLWRNFYLDCNMRKIDGEEFQPAAAAATSWITSEMVQATEENQLAFMKKYLDNGVKLDYWWMDAGWYYKTGTTSLDTWLTTGSWRVDEKRFPTKFKAISDYAHANGLKTLLWFEPEVVRDRSVLDELSLKEEWMLNNSQLVNMGNPEAVAFLLNQITKVLTEGDIDLYRQDYGVAYPATEWKANDTPNRAGITENLYVQGYLSLWDGLIERFPNMMIDSCAAGGGRNDLESMRRAVPLHKTDGWYSEHDKKQGASYALFSWFPYFGTVVNGPDTCGVIDRYALRSSYSSFPVMNFNLYRDDLEWEIAAECINEWNQIKDFLNDDYYPLTDWRISSDEWIGWQFFDSDAGAGFAEVFRPEEAVESEMTFKLYGLKNTATYRVVDTEGRFDLTVSGYDLKTVGLTVTLPEARTSSVILISEITE